MNQRKLAVLIGIAVGTASGAGLAQTDTTDRVVANPPPAAAQSMRGQTMIPDRLDRGLDDPRPVVEGDLGEAYEDEFAYEEGATAERDVIDEDISDDDIIDDDLTASEASPMRGVHQGHVAGTDDDALDVDKDGVVQTQSPHNDPTLANRVVTDDPAIDSRDQQPNDYASQPIGAGEFDQTRAQTRADMTDKQGKAVADVTEDGRTAVVVQHPTGTPFSRVAGTGGFEDAAPITREVFQTLDEDESGTLARGEIPETMTLGERFTDYDINGDGLIAKNEFQSYFAAQSWLEGEQDLPRFDREVAGDDTGLDVDVVEVDPENDEE